MKLKLFVFLTCVLAGCAQPAQTTIKSSNTSIEVEFLFEVDGVKVYRFSDAGHYVYFTNKGQTRFVQQEGKVTRVGGVD